MFIYGHSNCMCTAIAYVLHLFWLAEQTPQSHKHANSTKLSLRECPPHTNHAHMLTSKITCNLYVPELVHQNYSTSRKKLFVVNCKTRIATSSYQAMCNVYSTAQLPMHWMNHWKSKGQFLSPQDLLWHFTHYSLAHKYPSLSSKYPGTHSYSWLN